MNAEDETRVRAIIKEEFDRRETEAVAELQRLITERSSSWTGQRSN